MNTQQAPKQAQQPQQMQQPRVVNLPNLKKIRYAQNLAEVLQNRHVRPVVTLISMLDCDPCRLMKPRFIDFAQRNSEVFFAYIIIDEFDDKNLLLEKAGKQFPTFMIQFGEYLSIVPASLERMGEELNRLVVQVTNEEVARNSKKNGAGDQVKQSQQSNQTTHATAPSASAQYQQMPQGVQCSPDGTCTLPQSLSQQPQAGTMAQFAMMPAQQIMVPGYEAHHDLEQRTGKSGKRIKHNSSKKKHRNSKRSDDRRKSSDRVKHRGGSSKSSKRNAKNATSASSTDSKLYNESDSAQSSRASSRSSTSSGSSGSSSSVDSEKLMAIIDGRDKNRAAQLQMHAPQQGMFPASMQQMAQMPGAVGMMPAAQQQQPPLTPGVQMQLAQLAQMKQNIAAWSTRSDLTADMRALLMQQQAWVQACENKLNVEMNQGERMKMISDMRSRQNIALQEQQRQQQMMQQQQQMMQGMMGNMGFMQMPQAAGQMPQMQQQMPGQVPTQMLTPQPQGMPQQQQGGGGNYMQQHQQLMAQQQQRQMIGGMGHMNPQMLSTPATRISQNINNVRM
jgi:hypothetical protein